jgi:DNA-binding beta-propeller fold protein YncE
MRRTHSIAIATRVSGVASIVLPFFVAAAGAAAGCGGDSVATSATTSGGEGGSGGSAPTVADIMGSLPLSCAFACSDCPEPQTAFACPTVAPWASLPHDDACGAWDGTYPTPVQGKCTSGDATGEAARVAGAFAGGLVLPDGHRITPAGTEVVFDEAGVEGTFPMSIFGIPGTHLALVADGGIDDNLIRLIDVDALASGGDPVAGFVAFHQPSSIYYGVAWIGPTRALVSGGGDGKVYAFDVDTTAKTITAATDATIDIGLAETPSGGPLPFYVGPIAATGDGSRLLVGPSEYGTSVRVVSLGAADYGTTVGTVDLGSPAPQSLFDMRTDPFDATGNTVYATNLTGPELLEIDAATATVKRRVALGKNPGQIVFVDAKLALVAESDHDAIAVVDRSTMTVESEVSLATDSGLHGLSPSTLAYDATARRLWVTLAGVNAVEAFDVAPTTAIPTSVGSVPTAWWPTGVLSLDDGSLTIINGKGHGTGTDDMQYTWGHGPITELMRGSIQRVDATDLADLTASTATVAANDDLASLAGAAAVTCPNGADDFPIPTDNTHGPSKQIKHVILVVRENKTYDGVLGDLGTGNGDPTLIMASTPALQHGVWQNARAIAGQFTNFDNFYTDAEQSIQGHTWTVFGRTTDFMERTWLTIWGRGTRSEPRVISPEDTPEEQGVFTWLANAHVDVQDMGEIVGDGALDLSYPGLVFTQNEPDIEKSCYMVGRIRLTCDLSTFTYAVQPDDHTNGAQAGSAAPEVMIAVNDEATGLLLDGISHSPIWKDSLVIVTEDDPQDGGDHVDQHRSVLLMMSPWVKRAYTSHGHYDMASVYKLVSHVLGVPYNNEMMAQAMVPYDAFTSTPDYTPYTYLPRTVAAPCNPDAGAEAALAKRWDFDDLDDQPGLSQQIDRMMKDGSRGVRVVSPRGKDAKASR